MASLNPISNTASLTLSLGVIDGKVTEATANFSRMKENITATELAAFKNTIKNLMAYPVTATKEKKVNLLVEG